ncbi:M-phase inducer phosphatase-like isoform X2 [Phymastichus coffea]|uniref:M-phase inducer phosphatase-like isoform X2 n=1 Tax=Phymastichus coffea TaxID=108790 RepID=UPI00273C325A|nr:M-phase inducer phosphatase-like isoform X2 [Phymastichus coffea]
MFIMSPITGSCDVCQCTRLFRNAFQIRATPDSPLKKSSSKARRLFSMASSDSSTENSPNCIASSSHNEGAAMFSSPITGQNSTPHKVCGMKSAKARLPLEEFDPNSQDSGYGGCNGYSDEKQSTSNFRFAEPFGVAPRRLSLESRSPMKSPVRSSPQRKRFAHRNNLFRSLSSGYESTDDGFNDLIDMESLENESAQALPSGLSSLISGSIVSDKPVESMDVATTPEATSRKSFNFRRSMLLKNDGLRDEESTPPSISKVRSCLFRSPSATSSTAKILYDESPKRSRDAGFDCAPVPTMTRKFKRPDPPASQSPMIVKRSRKSTSCQNVSLVSNCKGSSPPPLLMRSLSETEAHAHIKSAINRSTTDSDLTGDFSKTCALPLAEGQHEDLKSISSETLSGLIRGQFNDQVNDFKIVDCRYPYEYDAGHIDGAVNLYTKEMIEEQLLDPLKHAPAIEPETQKRSILVFHCEFSWERGPKLSRFLRNIDRQRNKEHYPALHYPEIYLLDGGYEKFYKDQKELCSPQGYRPMRDPEHEADLKLFRSKSKSWQPEKINRANVITARANLKRLGF